nr:MAG TPA: hypothetical protein [Caudoviricetes sp.]
MRFKAPYSDFKRIGLFYYSSLNKQAYRLKYNYIITAF